jgi:hypothetical protein
VSHEAVKWAMFDAPMLLTEKGKPDTTARAVLIVLAEAADPDGTNSYPGPTRISYATGYDDRTVTRALRRLTVGGLIARDGTSRLGTARWKLAMEQRRPDSDWADALDTAEAERSAASRSRHARRTRPQPDLSGTHDAGQSQQPSMHRDADADTQSAGHIESGELVRHAESLGPARRVPDVRHATPPNPPETHPLPTHIGGHAAPQTPLRPQAPTPSGLGNEQPGDQLAAHPPPGDQDRNHRPRARGSAVRTPLATRLARYLPPDAQPAT